MFFFVWLGFSVSVEESIVAILCATWGFCREFLVLIIKILTVIRIVYG